MKKLATIVICTAFFALGLVGMASAQVEGGQYKMTATGSCLHSTTGFNVNIDADGGTVYTPKVDAHSKVWGATTMAEATWKFNADGTVSMSGINYPIDFPPGNPGLKSAAARQNGIGFPNGMKWEVNGNNITIKNPLGIITLKGTVSEDENTIIINSPFVLYDLGPPLYNAVCNTARVLIRMGDIPTP
jgi:hypothetical protein